VAALAVALLVPVVHAQQDPNRKVPNGGIEIAGWMARADSDTANDARLWQEGSDIMVSTGPAISYWNPANTASGNYMVKATFTEPKQVSGHPHPFGIFIGGNDLGTDQQTLLYCVAYRDGRVLVRGFSGTNVFTVVPAAANPAVHTAEAASPVTQEITWMVMNGTAECMINGRSVGKFDAAQTMGEGKLKSLDGVYGLRIAHDIDVKVSGFSMMKH
jgi:hypothetical protein